MLNTRTLSAWPLARLPLLAQAPWADRARSFGLRLAFAGALAAGLWALWSMQMAHLAAPPRRLMQQADLRLLPGQQAVLGRQALAAPAADSQHLRLSRDAQGAWWLANASGHLAVELRRGPQHERLRSVALEPGQRIAAAGDRWLVQSTQPRLQLHAVQGGQVWTYDGATLRRQPGADAPGAVQPACRDAAMSERLRQGWNRWLPTWLSWPAPVSWGGTAACGNRLPSAGLESASMQVIRREGVFWLEAQADAARRVCVANDNAPGCAEAGTLFERAVPLQGVDQVVLGRTVLAVATQGDLINFRTLRRGAWLAADAQPPSVEVQSSASSAATATLAPATATALRWQTEVADPLHWPLPVMPALALALAFAAAVALAALGHLRLNLRPRHALALGVSVVLSALAMLAFLLGSRVGEALGLGLVSLAVVSVVFLPLRTGWAWLAQALMALMLLAGLAMQWQLGQQSTDSGGWVYFQKTAATGACALFAINAVAWWLYAMQRRCTRLPMPDLLALEIALLAPAAAALVSLALQAMLGGEEGVFGIQPVELAKLALLLLGAHVLALRLEWAGQGGWRSWALWWRMVMPVLLFMALSATALMLLDDYSPLLLLAAWGLGMLLAWCVAAGSWGAAWLLVLALTATVHGVLWVRGDGLAWLQAHGFYGDRFAVWLELLRHPHSGEQVLRAMRVMSQGGLAGDVSAPAWRIPAVQFDMAPAFFTGRFGLMASMVLWGLQLTYVLSLLMLGWRALLAAGPGDHRRRWGLRLMFFAAWGAATIFAAHLVLSWGTNTGGLPVMGQPMPLLSAGGSVIVMLLAPLHLLWLLQPALLLAAQVPIRPVTQSSPSQKQF